MALCSAMAILIKVFGAHASKQGSKDTLNKSELKTLLDEELPGLLKGAVTPTEVDRFLNELDQDGDSEVNFTEFVTFIACFTTMIREQLN